MHRHAPRVLSTRGRVHRHAHARNSADHPLLSSLLLVRRILDLSLNVRPLVPVSSLSSSIEPVRLCLPDTLDPRPLDLPIGTVAATPSPPPPSSPFHPRMHPPSSADCESPSRYTRAVPSIVSIEGGHDGINYNA